MPTQCIPAKKKAWPAENASHVLHGGAMRLCCAQPSGAEVLTFSEENSRML